MTASVAAVAVAPALPTSRAGCSPSRPAVAADAAGRVLRPQPRGAPIPCGTTTGFGAGETRIFATKDAVIYAPAVFTPGPAGLGYGAQLPGQRFQLLTSPGGLAVTRNNGASWKAVLPMGMTWQPSDEQEYVDRTTGRFFFYNFGIFAWGGPVAQIALIKDRLVIQEKWITLARFQRVFSVYQILPGPEAAELCMFFGCLSAGRVCPVFCHRATSVQGTENLTCFRDSHRSEGLLPVWGLSCQGFC